ncbi:MAG: hypothetical protein KJ621_11790, partial [Proteobacteria bacterium]|nr:hypothetical protein [Pseudomonadota bacterium]MBU1742358.1 hypothetical protein [Pseudomonadota bacterium]
MRSILHYLFAGVVMTLYGSEVCPFLDSLDLGHFFLILLAATALAVGVRPVLVKHTVLGRDPRHQPRLQFLLDLGLLAVVGLGVGLFNGVAFGFPWHSGAKILAGFVLTGFFAATDLALQRERTVAADLARRGLHLTLDDRFFPMTRKFVLLASVCAASAFVVTFLIIVQDLSWLRFQDEISGLLLVWSRQLAWLHDAAAPRYWTGARLTVVIEVGFIAGLMLGYVLNLILSYSRNLRLLLDNETRVLERVHRGKFDAQVPVATNDEFGVIAVRTNEMIRGLKERTERLELTQDVTIVTLASLAETRDNETGGHIRRTQHYVRLLAEQLRR